ncbi:xaa-Pro aminopeptidase 2-like [Anneissia japonica]|uniref:xaa-Pro aminopeptidase 2-like n=1 Tax=Anneissia japonica TaxID=1529436 RepID=UPI001425B65B|nr:xaa-Pro aminopeptidase 2-like [Anneissia japonica]
MPQNSKIGYDATLLSVSTFERYEAAISEDPIRNLKMIEITENLVDEIWDSRPNYPNEPLIVLDEEFSGKKWQEKLRELQTRLKEEKDDGTTIGSLLVTKLDEIACKKQSLSGNLCVQLHSYEDFLVDVEKLNDDQTWVSDASASYAVYKRVDEV